MGPWGAIRTDRSSIVFNGSWATILGLLCWYLFTKANLCVSCNNQTQIELIYGCPTLIWTAACSLKIGQQDSYPNKVIGARWTIIPRPEWMNCAAFITVSQLSINLFWLNLQSANWLSIWETNHFSRLIVDKWAIIYSQHLSVALHWPLISRSPRHIACNSTVCSTAVSGW